MPAKTVRMTHFAGQPSVVPRTNPKIPKPAQTKIKTMSPTIRFSKGFGFVAVALRLVSDLDIRFFGFRPFYRSHSPITKSNEPRIAVVSLIRCPGNRCDRMLRLQNDGERIFIRYGVPPPRLWM